MTGTSSTAVEADPMKNAAGIKAISLPEIKVETSSKTEAGGGPATEGEKFGQARTPKHANKTRDETGAHRDQQKITPDRGESKPEESRTSYGHAPPHPHTSNHPGNFQPPRPYDGRPFGGGGAFHPHEPRRQPPPPGHGEYYSRSPPINTVSPGGGHHRYFPSSQGPTGRMEPGYPNHHSGGYYDQRGYSDHGPASNRSGYEGHPPHYRGHYQGPPPSRSGPPQPYAPSNYNGYPPPERGYSSYPPSASYSGSQPPPHTRPDGPPDHYSRPDARYGESHPNSNGNFSRAVSSSFDRSVKSRAPEEKPLLHGAPPKSTKSLSPTGAPTDASMASDDLSWKQLQQVHSIDDAAMKEKLKKEKNEATPMQMDRQPASTSSSLTNSPTEGPERLHAAREARRVVEAAVAVAASTVGNQQPSSLDSLSSVASAQAPIDTNKTKLASLKSDPPPPSPGTDSASLDLMKCSSGSSGLLHLPPHQRKEDALLFENKRGRDEERGDVNTSEGAVNAEELRRAPSEYDDGKVIDGQPPNKKVRVQEKLKDDPKLGEAKNKASPISITCSPSAEKAKESSTQPRSTRADYTSPQPMEGSFYDKPPTFSYSLDSAPSIPISRDGGHRKQPSYPSLPPRPGSSSSSTITPGHMQVDEQNPINAAVPSVHSWDIHAQDSFGNASLTGPQGLATSFSFQDYPGLAPAESDNASGGNPPGHSAHGTYAPPPPPPPYHNHRGMHPPIESRNQSFEGGHYHGHPGYHRTDSMDGGYGRAGPHGYPSQQGHQGSFPPHAPSWGTAGSSGSHPPYQGHPPGNYSQYGGRMGPDYHHGGVMRNYSQDSGHRMSPPPGPGGPMRHPRGPPPGFQPPSEFAAPHNPHLSRRPPPAVYIMPTSQGGGLPPHKRGNGVFSWSKEEDVRLTDIMKKYKNPRDWEPIAKEHGSGKSAKECHERWIRYLKPGVRKGQWSDQEDAIVIEAVTTSAEQPFTRWSDLAQRLPGRVGKQIRDRWVNHLNPNINHLPFSREDDLLLWEGHKKLGKRWVEISTKFFESSRSENHIKNRWYSASFKKFISNEFGPEAYAGSKNTKKDESKKKKTPATIKEEDPTIEAL